MKRFIIYLSFGLYLFPLSAQNEKQHEAADCEVSELIQIGSENIEALKGEVVNTESFGGDSSWEASKTLEGANGTVEYSSLTIPSQHYMHYILEEESDDIFGEALVDLTAAGYESCLGAGFTTKTRQKDGEYSVTVYQKDDTSIFLKKPHVIIKNEKWGDGYRLVVTVHFPEKD